MEKKGLGLVHIYYGNGKGKTSTALGLATRAYGRGYKVKIIQLFKGDTGEIRTFKKLKVPYLQFKPSHPFFTKYLGKKLEKFKEELMKFLFKNLKDIDKYDVVIIDEMGPALSWRLIEEDFLINLIKNKPEDLELILTGRGFPKKVLRYAHYVTEMKQRRHPFQFGIEAREGIEF